MKLFEARGFIRELRYANLEQGTLDGKQDRIVAVLHVDGFDRRGGDFEVEVTDKHAKAISKVFDHDGSNRIEVTVELVGARRDDKAPERFDGEPDLDVLREQARAVIKKSKSPAALDVAHALLGLIEHRRTEYIVALLADRGFSGTLHSGSMTIEFDTTKVNT